MNMNFLEATAMTARRDQTPRKSRCCNSANGLLSVFHLLHLLLCHGLTFVTSKTKTAAGENRNIHDVGQSEK